MLVFGNIVIFVWPTHRVTIVMSRTKSVNTKSISEIRKEITLDNSFHYISAIEEAVEKEITNVPVAERRLVLATIMSSLQIAEQTIYRLLKEAEVEEKKLS